jgi:hypothetical protein
VRLPFVPPYHKIQVDLLLFSNFEDLDPEQPTVDHDVSTRVFPGYLWIKCHSDLSAD